MISHLLYLKMFHLSKSSKKKNASFFIRYSNLIQKERRKQDELLTNTDDPLCSFTQWRLEEPPAD